MDQRRLNTAQGLASLPWPPGRDKLWLMQKSILMMVVILVLGAVGGCGLFPDKKDPTEGWSAERLYYEAKDALNSRYYSKAIEMYEKLQGRYPFGPFAQQAQIDLAYAYYKTEESAAAVAAADRFIRLYPTHTHVDYAYYLKGLANFNAGKGLVERYVPGDPSQRDPGAALQSFQDFAELIRRFPESRYVADSQLRMTYLRNILAQHEINVANYYMRRGAHVAAVNRARYVVENYPRTPSVPDALALMAKGYTILEMPDLATDSLRVLELNYPNHPGIGEVRRIVVR